ncbi:unnamed protein product [Sphenostylis stenocarpa]|uniref:Uncharacterized protein n=1 Tax=Sphenostylis stenocarpa TaxID=92480 RepID=A0AA86VCV2_9FABA|nr:unnamed protein product [Sphenostylis stenocarpa]
MDEALKSHMMLSFSGWEKKPTYSKFFAMLTPYSVAIFREKGVLNMHQQSFCWAQVRTHTIKFPLQRRDVRVLSENGEQLDKCDSYACSIPTLFLKSSST